MERKLNNKTVLVTGASRGIGKALAIAFAEEGAKVILHYHKNNIAAEEALSMMEGSKHALIQADISDPDALLEMVDKLNTEHGHIDVLVNNAGIYLEKKQMTEDVIEKTFAVNHLDSFLLSYELLPLLKASTRGRIITVSSYAHRMTPLVVNQLPNPWPYIGLLAYKCLKLCNVLFSHEFNRIHDNKLIAVALDPGLVDTSIASKGSNGISDWVWQRR